MGSCFRVWKGDGFGGVRCINRFDDEHNTFAHSLSLEGISTVRGCCNDINVVIEI